MLTMTTKQFRNMIREAGIASWQMYTNPSALSGARNVGVMLKTVDGNGELQKLTEVMKKHGHDLKAHNVRVTGSRHPRYNCGWFYTRGVAKYEE